MSWSRAKKRSLALGLAFLAPNILGFLSFTLFPLVFSLILAFTNWDLRLHNIFRQETLRFAGFENFSRLLTERDFWKYLGNTAFLMMGIPFGIAGSLITAILLSRDLRGGSRRIWVYLVAVVLLVLGTGALLLAGAGATGMTILIAGLVGLILMGGTLGGSTVYRTLFYLPHFTAGVATFILWKKLYNPHTGPINNALRPLLQSFGSVIQATPPGVLRGIAWACLVGMAMLVLTALRRLSRAWRDGEAGRLSVVLGGALLLAPAALATRWAPWSEGGLALAGAAGAMTVLALAAAIVRKREFRCRHDEGLGFALMFCGVLMIAQFALLGLSRVAAALPAMAANPDGMTPPEWITSYYWAKPAIMIMGFWGAIGSNNMLLYLAGLSNVPQDLYEAASIDGASPMQRFWNVTWPQLAPVTFFIVVMSVIGGLQGGFEMARTMTQGGPAGATTTLSYFVYTQGFETGRLGYASGIAWTLFLLVFLVTLFNWKFGNKYVND
ncbi:MAG TPA: hypothetical protein DCX07_15925 [Phycisphaerales bacterium]|nr:hypothetical protein [Phycisphaerales bacterium]